MVLLIVGLILVVVILVGVCEEGVVLLCRLVLVLLLCLCGVVLVGYEVL